MKLFIPLSLSLAVLLIGPFAPCPRGADAQTTFTDVTTALDMEQSFSGVSLGGGASWTDVDRDGDFDLIVSCGVDCSFQLFRNKGGTGFAREDFGPVLDGVEESKAVVCSDVDDDGDQDMFCSSRPGIVRFFRSGQAGYVEKYEWGWSSGLVANLYGVALADYDQDGDLDVYAADHGGKNVLLRNDGETFVNIAADLGVTNSVGLGFQVVWFDYDNDGDQDLYVANDKGALTGRPNVLFRNDGDGTFTDVSVESGAGLAGALMGIAIGDYDNDGDLDFYVTNTPDGAQGIPGNVLGRNNGDGTFTEVARSLGVAVDETCWGANFFDADNDGDLDLYVAAMHTTDTDRFFLNDGAGGFTDATFTVGIQDLDFTFGSAVADYDNDGDLDIYVVNSTGTNRLFRNDGASLGNWIKLRLRGTESNRDAIGARVTVRDGSRQQIRELQAGNSYLSQDAPEIHFGFGSTALIDELEIRWPSGQVQLLTDVAVNQTLALSEPPFASVLAAQAGTVNAGVGSPVDILFVNGSAGDALREVTVPVGSAMTLQLDAPPSQGVANYVVYALMGVPRSGSLEVLPYNIGVIVRPTPISGGRAFAVLNNLGHTGRLGKSARMVPPAPFEVTRTAGINQEIVFSLQAIIEDSASAGSVELSTSNALTVFVR